MNVKRCNSLVLSGVHDKEPCGLRANALHAHQFVNSNTIQIQVNNFFKTFFNSGSNKIKAFEEDFLQVMKNSHRAELDVLKSGKLTSEVTDVIRKVVSDLSGKYAS